LSDASLAAHAPQLRAALQEDGVAAADVELVLSPYRVCPIGAHSDHQGGPVLGIAISAGTLLAFAPSDGPAVRILSEGFEDEARFTLPVPPAASSSSMDELDRLPAHHWSRYARAAASVLADRLPAEPRGFVGRVHGSLPGGGLSSSASVLLAYLLAFARANALRLEAAELVQLARRAENESIGVASGILDPAAIVGAERGRLLFIDTRASRWRSVAIGADAPAHRLLVAYTGLSRNLTGTSFNQRVAECREAARLVAERAGLSGVALLGDLDDAVLTAHAEALPAAPRGRARHFLGERRRVLAGVEAWRGGDLARFGELMSESCRSSVENYETGAEEQVALQRILLETPGVLGARFSGAGYGGCSVALVAAEAARDACVRVEREFVRARPELAGKARVFCVESEDGVRLV
jgi:galactokinase